MSSSFAARFRGRALVDVLVACAIGVVSGYFFWVPALEEYHSRRRAGGGGDGAGVAGGSAGGSGAGGGAAVAGPPVERLR